jgi:hypothetical protein
VGGSREPRRAFSRPSQGCSLVASGTTSSLLSLHSTILLGDEDGGSSILDVLVGRGGNHEGGDVDHLLADSDVSLSDEDSRVVHRLGEVLSDDNSLESSLEELLDGKTEDVIELSLALLEQAELADSSDEGITFEKSSGIALIESEELSSSLSELGEGELDSPHFSLVAETVLTDELQLGGESFLIEGLSGRLRSFLVVSVSLWHSNIDVGQVDPDSLGRS